MSRCAIGLLFLVVATNVMASTYTKAKPDLRGSLTGPDTAYAGETVQLRTTAWSDAVSTSNVVVKISTGCSGSSAPIWPIQSVTGATCTNHSAAQTCPSASRTFSHTQWIECTIRSIPAGRIRGISLTLGVPSPNEVTYPWVLSQFLDPGNSVAESNERNNGDSHTIEISHRPDLAVNWSCSNNACDFHKTETKTIWLSARNLTPSDVSGVTVKGSVANFEIRRVFLSQDNAATAFACTFNRDAANFRCTGGRLFAGNGRTARIGVEVKPKWFLGGSMTTPIIATIDPDNRLAEKSETNNMHTQNVKISGTTW